MINLKFYLYHDMNQLKEFSFGTYKEFFEFYRQYANKGCIFEVEDDGETEEAIK